MRQSWLRKSYRGLVQTENFVGQVFLFIIRLYWGYLLFKIGLSKWMNLRDTAHFFTSLHIPAPAFSAWLAGCIEVVGGISLFLGLFSRVMSLVLAVFFLIVYATAHTEAMSSFFSSPNSFFESSPFLFLLVSLIVLSFGPGFLSFDYWMERAQFGKNL